MSVKIPTPYGDVTVFPSVSRVGNGDHVIRAVSLRLTLERPDTKSKSLWEVSFTVPIDPDEYDPNGYFGLQGRKAGGEGWQHLYRNWHLLMREVRAAVLPVIWEWLAAHPETVREWQRAHYDYLAQRASGKAEDAERTAKYEYDRYAEFRKLADALR